MYSDKVIETFKNVNNAGVLRGANGVGTVTDPICGDVMRIYLLIENNTITESKFKVFGCVASIASCAILSELVQNCPIDDINRISEINVLNELDGLPAEKQHCASLAVECLQSAVQDYYKRLEKEQKLQEQQK